MADWSPAKYLEFASERARPALDLIQRIPTPAPNWIVDLGCGPGNSAALLRQSFPKARITGVDSSPAMMARAKLAEPSADYMEGDAANWHPAAGVDVVFSNALFQWVPQHEVQIQRILSALAPGSVLAIQVPDNLQEPSHVLMAQAASSWVGKSESNQILDARSSILTAAQYARLLEPISAHAEIWRTTYYHRLKDHHAIAEMLGSTGLKPWLEAVGADDKDDFLKAYVTAIMAHYPALADGSVLYPFPRLFMIAVRK